MKKIHMLVLLLVMAGCSTSKITTFWKAPDIQVQQYNKIMVLALVPQREGGLQEKMEDHLVGDLQDLGYNVVSALKEFGPKAFDVSDEEAAIAKLQNSGVDAVITVVLLDKKKESNYVPGRLIFSPYGYYYGHFGGYRAALYHRIYEPGYYVTDTKYFWESNLYEMKTQKLIYSVHTESFDPVNAASLGHEYGILIVNNMVRQQVLQQKKMVEKE
jgi:hypothetical protein